MTLHMPPPLIRHARKRRAAPRRSERARALRARRRHCHYLPSTLLLLLIVTLAPRHMPRAATPRAPRHAILSSFAGDIVYAFVFAMRALPSLRAMPLLFCCSLLSFVVIVTTMVITHFQEDFRGDSTNVPIKHKLINTSPPSPTMVGKCMVRGQNQCVGKG